MKKVLKVLVVVELVLILTSVLLFTLIDRNSNTIGLWSIFPLFLAIPLGIVMIVMFDYLMVCRIKRREENQFLYFLLLVVSHFLLAISLLLYLGNQF
ncbi:MAG: hypothetical protein Q7R60_04175 [bacterium]|nr:hypothetical protein [bacterium]